MGIFKNEVTKVLKSKLVYTFIAVNAFFIALTAYIEKTGLGGLQTTITSQNAQSLALSFVNSNTQIMAVFISIHAAFFVANELKKGTFKLPLLRAVSRTSLIRAKIFAMLFFIAFVTLVNIIASYVAGMVFFGWGESATYKDATFPTFMGIAVTFFAYLLTFLPYMAFGMIAIFIAIKTENMTASIIASVGISFVGQLFYPVEQIRDFSLITQMYFLPDYMILGNNVMQKILSIVVSSAYFALFYYLSLKTIKTKEIVN